MKKGSAPRYQMAIPAKVGRIASGFTRPGLTRKACGARKASLIFFLEVGRDFG
jgi:hypothetical protein